jgi:hypothetical protein
MLHDVQNDRHFQRAILSENGEVVYKNNSERHDYKQAEIGTPDYTDLPLDQYISVIEIANPMHSLWSDGRWNQGREFRPTGFSWINCWTTFHDTAKRQSSATGPILPNKK